MDLLKELFDLRNQRFYLIKHEIMFPIQKLQLTFILLMLNLPLFAQKFNSHDLISGDLILCSYDSGKLSGAIDEVTQTSKATHYSHMALVEIVDQKIFVIHASLKRGVVKETLTTFFQIDQPTKVDAYRINRETLVFTEPLEKANNLVGLPYNASYIMNDTSYYCSQLIYDVYKGQGVFQLEPMTFKNPSTNEFNTGWVQYYNNLGIEIPEGQPGCNPNGLAASSKLILIGSLK